MKASSESGLWALTISTGVETGIKGKSIGIDQYLTRTLQTALFPARRGLISEKWGEKKQKAAAVRSAVWKPQNAAISSAQERRREFPFRAISQA
jgi:hypothetical protein